jgi:replicative DNA helicase
MFDNDIKIQKISEHQNKVVEKHYPYDELLEMSYLGSLLLGGKKVYDETGHMLTAQDYYRPAHQALHTAMTTLIADTGYCDIVLLADALQSKGHLEVSGGLAYLMQIGDIVPTTAHAKSYAKGIRKYAEYRNIVINAEFAMAKAQQGEVEPEEIALTFAQGTESKKHTDTVMSASDVFDLGLDILKTGRKKGLSSGFMDVDKVVDGWRNSELIIVGGRPSMGKSSLGLQYAINAARQCIGKQGGALFVSAEMSLDMISQRLMQVIAGVDGRALNNTYLSETDRNALTKAKGEVKSLPLYFDTDTPVTVASIRAKARDLRRQDKLSIIVVDYLQMMDTGKATEGRTRDIGVLSRGLKNIAKEFDVPVIALSSLSRASEQRQDKRPIMSDLRESGDIESDADIIQFVYRPDYYAENRNEWDSDFPSEAEIITAKNRNGSIGVSRLEFTKHTASFKDVPEGSL